MKEIKIWKMILIYLGTSFLVIFGVTIYSFVKGTQEINDLYLSFVLSLSVLLVTLMSGRVGIKLAKERFNNFKKVDSIKEIIIVVATQIFLSIGLSNLSLGFVAINDKNKALEVANETFGNPTNNIELVIFLISVVIIAPLLEEIIFRRIVFKRLNMRFSFTISAIVSSLVFGIGHEFLGILGAIVFGVACCLLYIKYNNLLVPITVHVVNNLLSGVFTSISYFNGSLNEKVSVITNFDIKMNFVSGTILTAITLIIFIRFANANKQYIKTNKSRLQI
ncbi:hypothetical protein TPDSL_20850 [Terrisporobacter petrolearius]|uniref:CPBP family intramembrane glutamic endopeptidase n=1 Tax=Terrisporobacter petrolearius TaxID=1460447 RepID=UPI003368C5E6